MRYKQLLINTKNMDNPNQLTVGNKIDIIVEKNVSR